MKIETIQNRNVIMTFDEEYFLDRKNGKILLSYQQALDLFDKLETELWDEPTHRELESKIDQLEYELMSVKGELDNLRECGNEKYRDW